MRTAAEGLPAASVSVTSVSAEPDAGRGQACGRACGRARDLEQRCAVLLTWMDSAGPCVRGGRHLPEERGSRRLAAQAGAFGPLS